MRKDAQGWRQTGEQAFGMVLERHPTHASAQARFVVALFLRDDAVSQRASPDVATANSEIVLVKYVRNWHFGQRQLNGIERLGVTSIMNPVLTNLRTLMVPQSIQARSFRDLRVGPEGQYDPAMCSTALGWFMISSLPLVTMWRRWMC
jgi:hypothetical protein